MDTRVGGIDLSVEDHGRLRQIVTVGRTTVKAIGRLLLETFIRAALKEPGVPLEQIIARMERP